MENTFAAAGMTSVVQTDADSEQVSSAWILAARAGEPWALEHLYRIHVASVHALCARILGRRDDAEDAVQSTFVQAFRNLPRFRGDSSPKTWLYRIAVNQCISLLRKRRDTDAIPESACADDNSPAWIMRESVSAVLSRLNAEHRTVLALRYWECMDCGEIASILGISISAAKMRLYRARIEFKRDYEGDLP
jgi:RNA polymerase sigma-70 factor (ECF subfamily)